MINSEKICAVIHPLKQSVSSLAFDVLFVDIEKAFFIFTVKRQMLPKALSATLIFP